MLISGKNINMRTVELNDADFIYDMRQNQSKTKYLSKVSGTIEDQKNWINGYKLREKNQKEFYYIIETKEGEKLGLVRMYDFKDDSFCWGSWLIKDNAPKSTAIESVLLIYEFSFYQLGFNQSHFSVRKGNDKVISFHKRFGAKVVEENDLEYFFIFSKIDYEEIKAKYKRYL